MGGLTLVQVVREAEREHWGYASWWLLFTMLGALFPIWAVVILAFLWEQGVRWEDLGAHGELALYAAALVAPALHPVLRDVSGRPFVHRRSFGFLGVGILLVATLVFAGTWAAWKGAIVLNINQDRLFATSVVVLLFSIAFVFFVTLVDAVRTSPDPARAMHREQEALARAVRPEERTQDGQ